MLQTFLAQHHSLVTRICLPSQYLGIVGSRDLDTKPSANLHLSNTLAKETAMGLRGRIGCCFAKFTAWPWVWFLVFAHQKVAKRIYTFNDFQLTHGAVPHKNKGLRADSAEALA